MRPEPRPSLTRPADAGRSAMPLPEDIRELADRVVGRLNESREFYLHTQQAWRVVQMVAHEGRSVGIVDNVSGQDLAPSDLEAAAQRYVTVHLTESVFKGVIERVIRELAYRGPAQWFRFIDNRVNLGCPNQTERGFVCEVKAARDILEHNRGLVGSDYVVKAGAFARYAEGDVLQIDEPYLLQCFTLLREVISAMAEAAIRRSSGPPLPDPNLKPLSPA